MTVWLRYLVTARPRIPFFTFKPSSPPSTAHAGAIAHSPSQGKKALRVRLVQHAKRYFAVLRSGIPLGPTTTGHHSATWVTNMVNVSMKRA